MPPFKEPTPQERAQRSMEAKRKAMEALRNKPAVDEAVLAERRAAQAAKAEADARAREEKRLAREAEAAEKRARREAEAQAAAEAEAAKQRPKLSDEEKKAARDARYAARKQRSGKR